MDLKEIDFIDIKECSEISEKIVSLNHLWLKEQKIFWKEKHPDIFHTLGLPIYQSTNNIEVYFEQAYLFNKTLYKYFELLYEKLKNKLSDIIGEKAFYDFNLAIPGFHIFKYNSNEVIKGGCPHFDLQFLNLKAYQYSPIDIANVYTFILPLQLPNSGANLKIWDFHYNEVGRQFQNTDFDLLNSRKSMVHNYSIGKIVIKSGLYCHQIGETNNVENGDMRITLQGHCFKMNEKLYLYW